MIDLVPHGRTLALDTVQFDSLVASLASTAEPIEPFCTIMDTEYAAADRKLLSSLISEASQNDYLDYDGLLTLRHNFDEAIEYIELLTNRVAGLERDLAEALKTLQQGVLT